MEDRIIELEIRLAHQDALLADLSDVLYRQGREIDTLRLEMQRLREQLRAQTASNIALPSEETPPPHY
ncbi:SlyX family protein [Plasticicumulans acidivorans]|uniref:SlyX protein n=1 Tax=Plasticicumulans acidivorans TaxID=886464 RepID=A0A317MUS2_9GAMM|nr:SlyX family protein [Plasticicumulans acidivorans]PWV61658.1 SlyX protein [Plasticicumulans acidivorans]